MHYDYIVDTSPREHFQRLNQLPPAPMGCTVPNSAKSSGAVPSQSRHRNRSLLWGACGLVSQEKEQKQIVSHAKSTPWLQSPLPPCRVGVKRKNHGLPISPPSPYRMAGKNTTLQQKPLKIQESRRSPAPPSNAKIIFPSLLLLILISKVWFTLNDSSKFHAQVIQIEWVIPIW